MILPSGNGLPELCRVERSLVVKIAVNSDCVPNLSLYYKLIAEGEV